MGAGAAGMVLEGGAGRTSEAGRGGAPGDAALEASRRAAIGATFIISSLTIPDYLRNGFPDICYGSA